MDMDPSCTLSDHVKIQYIFISNTTDHYLQDMQMLRITLQTGKLCSAYIGLSLVAMAGIGRVRGQGERAGEEERPRGSDFTDL